MISQRRYEELMAAWPEMSEADRDDAVLTMIACLGQSDLSICTFQPKLERNRVLYDFLGILKSRPIDIEKLKEYIKMIEGQDLTVKANGIMAELVKSTALRIQNTPPFVAQERMLIAFILLLHCQLSLLPGDEEALQYLQQYSQHESHKVRKAAQESPFR